MLLTKGKKHTKTSQRQKDFFSWFLLTHTATLTPTRASMSTHRVQSKGQVLFTSLFCSGVQ